MPKKHRKMLTDWQAPYILPILRLIESQSKATIAKWCLDYCQVHLLPIYERAYAGDMRPRQALDAARSWLAGEIKLPEAKKIILTCHEAAREADTKPAAQAAARAIGQCAATIHVPTHSAGLMFYGALAVAYDEVGVDANWDDILARVSEECNKMELALRNVAIENEANPAKLNWNC